MSEDQVTSCEQEEDNEVSSENYFHETLTGSKITHFYLNGSIRNTSPWYYPALQLFNTASPYDEIYFHLNTIGGALSESVQLLNAINTCQGNVHLIVEGECSSAGNILAFGGKYKSIQINDVSTFLFHTAAAGRYHRVDIAKAYLKGIEQWSNLINRQCYQGILTEEELTQLEEGAEIHLLAPEIKTRLAARDNGGESSDIKKKSSKKES